jgi:hypothetical protein
MSEYQYYEFACVDQLLTATQQAELRSFSTRATITASSFVNEYQWGNLKGDPLEWVQNISTLTSTRPTGGTAACFFACRMGFSTPRLSAITSKLDEIGDPVSRKHSRPWSR